MGAGAAVHGWVRERGVLGVGAGTVPTVGAGRGRAVAWEGQGAAGGGWAAAPVGSMGGGVEGQPAKGRV